jgi:flavorubredoxin
MKITIFQADKGDCLMIQGQDGRNIFADGGIKGSYRKHVRVTLGELANNGEIIDLVYVSHIDQDHIGGIPKISASATDAGYLA